MAHNLNGEKESGHDCINTVTSNVNSDIILNTGPMYKVILFKFLIFLLLRFVG